MTNEQAIKMQMRIKKIRTDNKLKQAEFGQQFNVSGSTISGYENGATQVPLDILILIALKYNVSLDYLVGISEDVHGRFADEENKILTDMLVTPLINSGNSEIEAMEAVCAKLEETVKIAAAELKGFQKEIEKKKSEETQENDT